MKDEFKGRIISQLIGLKSKMYSLIILDDEEVAKAKEVNKKIKHKEFVDFLFNKIVIRHNMKRIKSKLHRIHDFDNKRYVLDDDVNSLAYFHKGIKDR